MGVSVAAFIVSVLLLAHSAYSAYEVAQLRKHLPVAAIDEDESIPLDIKVEALLGLLAAIVGSILSVAGSLKPIKFSKSISELEAKGQSPYAFLDNRPSFQDVLAKREEYTEWAKKNSNSSS